jgi:hypothetical protein
VSERTGSRAAIALLPCRAARDGPTGRAFGHHPSHVLFGMGCTSAPRSVRADADTVRTLWRSVPAGHSPDLKTNGQIDRSPSQL